MVATEVLLQFKGQLLLPDEPGPGLPVNLDVADHHLAVESEDGGLGAWPLEVVDVRRLRGDLFAMTVAGEDLHFVADDTIAFVYSGLPAIQRTRTKRSKGSPLRTFFDKIWTGDPITKASPPAEGAAPTTPPPAPPPNPELAEAEPGTRPDERPGEIDPLDGLTYFFDNIPVSDLDELTNVPETSFFEVREPEPEPGPEPAAREPIPVSAGYTTDPGPPTETQEPDLDTEISGCPALRSDGRPCLSPIITSSGFCFPHDPDRSTSSGYESALLARSSLRHEGTARLNRVYKRLDKAMRQVERGELEPEIAMAMAQLARTMCAILDLEAEPGSELQG